MPFIENLLGPVGLKDSHTTWISFRGADQYNKQTQAAQAKSIGGDVSDLGSPDWVNDLINVRFRFENVQRFLPDTFANPTHGVYRRWRYLLYNYPATDLPPTEAMKGRRQRGSTEPPEVRSISRPGTGPTQYTPEHGRMQAQLMADLKKEYEGSRVLCEQDHVDIKVQTREELIFFEIKCDREPRSVIRQALGQILEYAYHPRQKHDLPVKLVIVGRCAFAADDQAYLDHLRREFRIPPDYRAVSV